jgi:hypothetical protein
MVTIRLTPSTHRFARLAVVAILGLATITVARAAEGSSAERSACTGDAFRLCASAMPSSDAVQACMLAHQSQLSPGCLATFPKTEAKVVEPRHAPTRAHTKVTSKAKKRVRTAG